jgi:transcription initiation factor TFIIB
MSLVLPPTPQTKKKKKSQARCDVDAVLAAFQSEDAADTKAELVYDRLAEYENRSCECGGSLRVLENGFEACERTGCGLMRTDVLDSSPEWRYYNASDGGSDPTRCGLPVNPLLHESSYGCRVACPWRATWEMKKVRRYTEWQAMPYTEKARYDEFVRITAHAMSAGIPRIAVDSALRYHTLISKERTFRGLNRDGIIAASIYIACLDLGIPRTPKEIAVIFNLDAPSATRGCKNAMSILNSLERGKESEDKSKFKRTSPEDFIARYGSKLGMSNELVQLSCFVAMKVHCKNLIPENTPHSVAAGVLYFIAVITHAAVSKRDVHAASDISEVTINKCYKKLAALESQLIPRSVVDRYAAQNTTPSVSNTPGPLCDGSDSE